MKTQSIQPTFRYGPLVLALAMALVLAAAIISVC
jgi:hypothetical protein